MRLVVLVAILLRLDPTLALLLFAAFPPFRWLSLRVGRRQAGVEAEWRDLRGAGAGLLQEALAGVRTVKAFGREDRAMDCMDLEGSMSTRSAAQEGQK